MNVKKTIYLVTLPNGSFGSAGQSWKQLDLDKIRYLLDYDVSIKTILDIQSLDLQSNDIIIYTSSENEIIRTYLKNNLFHLSCNTHLIPSYELLMAHEDKGFQEVIKRRKDFGNLKGQYFFDIEDNSLPFPKVLKTTQGAGSSGVFLVNKKDDLKKIRSSFFKDDIKRRAINGQRKLKLQSSEYRIYKYTKKKFNLFVEQKFIPDLKHDFKILIFGNRYFVLKRNVKKNDFRASGSGNFEFVEPPYEVLDFAKEVAKKLGNPYFSLDIAQSEHGCHLIEFQATNFGPYTLLNAPYRYLDKDGKWLKEQNCKDLEANYAYALNYYLSKIND